MKLINIALAAALAAVPAGAVAENATLDLGAYSSGTEILEGSVTERGMPFNYMYTYSGGQILYPNALVKEIADRNGEISSITFRYRENGTFYDGDIEGTSTVWVMATDMQEIPVENNKSAWIKYSTVSNATASIDHAITYGEEVFEVTYTLSTPVKLAPGQSLLVTASSQVTNGMAPYMYDFDCFGFKIGTGSAYTAYYGSDTESFETNYAAETPNQWNSLYGPVARVAYSYVDKLPQAEAPVFSPASGTALGPDDKVTITAAEGTSILYTLEKDGTPDIPYAGPIALDKAATVTAVATQEGHDPSDPVAASYTLKTSAAPTFGIPSGTLLGANELVTISAAEGAKILYTLDPAAEPDTEYPAEGLKLSADATVKAVAVEPGAYTSRPTEARYTVSDLDATVIGGYYAVPTSDNTFIGTNWYNAPIIPTYANSASQMLYLPDELAGFTDKTRIRSLSFRFTNETCFTDYTSSARIYLESVDANRFDYDEINSKYRWFDVDLSAPVSTEAIDIPFVDYYYSTGELSFELPDGGFEVTAGRALLVTIVNEAATPLDNSEYPQFLKYNTPDSRRTATFASDKVKYAESLSISDYVVNGEGFYSSMTDYNQPCLKMFTDNLGTQGIAADAVATPDAPAEYYNLQGMRVHGKLAPGVYIRRAGSATAKVLVR